ncbi:presqualene diphosphate synthase HpnD [Sciscionella marina]|uniref:presqualene diphosphate synthase HpnD n=1 Tax=Sciscionella marina TaxID=508770 RepID=UPI000367413A|nr:presqualene diphosphate synthase HpnD [Sciscionella marina]
MNLDEAYQRCEQITTEQARNFSYGIKLLPKPKRAALSAVYAFARRIDDIGDGQDDAETKLAGLALAEQACADPAAFPEDPVLVAIADTRARTGIPMRAFEELIEGCRADVLGTGYPDFEGLRHYCRCVAGSIGRLSLAVFGADRTPANDRLADSLGIALQLTNILRDIREDRINGRIYLPAEDLERFGCTLDIDADGALLDEHDALLALIEFEAARAQEWYAEGMRLLGRLDRRSRACCAAMAGIYQRLLTNISLRPWQVLDRRVSLPGMEKAGVAARALAGAF